MMSFEEFKNNYLIDRAESNEYDQLMAALHMAHTYMLLATSLEEENKARNF